jgi:CheY-like chemotaxis protein
MNNRVCQKSQGSILCIDDDDDDASLLESAVKAIAEGIEFRKCYGGNEALALLKSMTFQPDVILLDVNMPMLNGFDCLREIKRSPHLREIPIIMLSTSASPKDVSLALELGAWRFFTKPNTYTQIQSMMANIIQECLIEQ